MLKDFTLQKQKDFQMNRNIDIYPRSTSRSNFVRPVVVEAKLQPPVLTELKPGSSASTLNWCEAEASPRLAVEAELQSQHLW